MVVKAHFTWSGCCGRIEHSTIGISARATNAAVANVTIGHARDLGKQDLGEDLSKQELGKQELGKHDLDMFSTLRFCRRSCLSFTDALRSTRIPAKQR